MLFDLGFLYCRKYVGILSKFPYGEGRWYSVYILPVQGSWNSSACPGIQAAWGYWAAPLTTMPPAAHGR